MKLIFIRHGYSKSNEKGLFTGRTNVSLTHLGFIQAKKTAEFLAKNFSIDKIYSSPLKRARQTARPIADAFGLPVIIDYALCEIDGGKWEEKSAEQLMQLYPEDYSLWLTNIGLAHCTGGESMLQVQQRALNEVLRIAAENPGKTVALVTHAGVIRTQQCVWQNIPPENMKDIPWVPNASYSVVDCDGGKFNAEIIGCDKHLADISTNLPKGI